MKKPKLWVIDPSCKVPETQGVKNVLENTDPSSTLFEPALKGNGPKPGQWPDDTVDGIVVMGSAVSVYDEVPWLKDLSEWLKPFVTGERQLPVLGICFGHQLIGHLAHGEVGFLYEDRAKEVGYRTTSLSEKARLAPSGEYRVLASHREVVQTMPTDWLKVGTRPGVTWDVFEHNELDIFGVQFHPEAGPEFLLRAGLDDATYDDEARRTARCFLGGFKSICVDP